MGLTASLQLANPRRISLLLVAAASLARITSPQASAQSILPIADSTRSTTAQTTQPRAPHTIRANRFLSGRTLAGNLVAGKTMDAARQQQAAMLADQITTQSLPGLNALWQPMGPNHVGSISYGNVTGRITSIAIDPNDQTGNTVYLGTTGGGVWKSSNAAGSAAGVTFAPLTDTLPVFSPNAGNSAIPSLSIGSISIQPGVPLGVVLAGTGDPNDASDSYYGGGLLRSVDEGLTWTLVQQSLDGASGNHSFTGLGFAGFAWNYIPPNIAPTTVVAAVSQATEGTLTNAPDTNSVMGLYYSMDEGATWQMSIIMDGTQYVQRPLPSGQNLGGVAATAIVWNPIRQRFYAAIRLHGYYESQDGVIWTRLANQPGTNLTLAACPTTGNPMCPIFRGSLAVQPTTGDLFALTVDSNNLDQGLWQDACGSPDGKNCTSNTVTFSQQLNSVPLEIGPNATSPSTTISQADYNLSLAAVPSGSAGGNQNTLLFVGTTDLYRCSLNDDCTLRNTTNATNACDHPAQVAPAQHAIATFTTASQPLLYLGNDGGLWRSIDNINQQGMACNLADATHFQNLNSGLGSLAEVVSFAQDQSDPNTLLVGLGANGTAATSTASSLTTAWPQLSTGEGGTVAIDTANPQLWYVSTAAGVNIRQCANGGACTAADFTGNATIASAQTALDDSLVDPPWLLDPANSENVIVGTCRVWRGPANNASLWSSSNAISRLLAGPQNTACGNTNSVLRSLSAGGPVAFNTASQNEGSKTLLAGMAGSHDGGGNFGGHLFSTAIADTATNTTTWTDLALSPVTNDPGGFNAGAFDLSSLVVDPHDATGKTIYATIMGFTGNGINAPHLYRSIDGGANWTNISSNLPNAPANSVVVDPNDANTLYIAMDTGVYVTTQVSSCDTGNCWSIYGTSLPNAPIVQLAAAQSMPTGDGRIGELRAGTYGRGIWQIPLLNAIGSAPPIISLNPATLAFATTAVGSASATQTITVTNTGASALTISQLAISQTSAPSQFNEPDFNETDNCTSAAIAPNDTCTIQAAFLPAVTGTRTATLTVFGNVSGGQATVQLTGSATPSGAIVLTPIALVFPSTLINATSMAQNVTISNLGSTTLSLQPPSVTGDFKLTANTCGPTLAPQVGCTVSIAFTPSISGTRTGTMTLTDGAGAQTTSLIGTGESPATDALSPLALTFAETQITTTSPSQQVILTNSGDLPLTLIAAQITSGDFTAVNNCGNSLNPHTSCSISVAFQPKNLGTLTGTLAVSDQYGKPQIVALNGTGIAPPGVSLAPFSTVAFPNTGLGLFSPAQLVTLTNNDATVLLIQSILLAGDFSLVPNSNTCGTEVEPFSACTMQVVFTPTMVGPRPGGLLTVNDSGTNSPQRLTLTGTGIDFTLTPDGSTNLTITSGQNAVFPMLVSSQKDVPGIVTFTCQGIPANSTCNVTPSTVTLGGVTTVSFTILTGVAPTSSVAASPQKNPPLLWLTALLPLSLIAQRRRRLPHLIYAVLLCLFIPVSGCGAGREIPSASGPATPGTPTSTATTPAGTYTIVASASSAGLNRTLTLTLTVQ